MDLFPVRDAGKAEHLKQQTHGLNPIRAIIQSLINPRSGRLTLIRVILESHINPRSGCFNPILIRVPAV